MLTDFRFGSVIPNFGGRRFGSVRSFLEIGSVRFFFRFGSVFSAPWKIVGSVRFVFFLESVRFVFFFRFGSVFSAPRKIVGSNRFVFFVGFFSVRFGSTTYVRHSDGLLDILTGC